jgi:hypothetical protein
MMSTWSLFAICVLAATTQLPPAAAPPPSRDPKVGDAPPLRTGTAVIRGRIAERDTDVPIANIDVRLHQRGWPRPYQTRTDTEGRYAFARLPAGQYHVSAQPSRNRATHLQGAFVDGSPDTSGSARPLALAEGEIRDGVNIALTRLVAITGRVLDEDGTPLSDIRVHAEPLSRTQGMSISRSRDTDDRGTFRLFAVPPGRYRLCADPGTEVATDSQEAFVRTCYPSTLVDADSPAVAVTGSDSAEVEIRMIRTRVFSLAGRVVDVSGAPAPNASLSLTRILKDGNAGGRGWQVDESGGFSVRGLAPGEYAVHAEIGGQSVVFRGDDGRDHQVAYTRFLVNSDIGDLVIALARPARVVGRVTLEDGPRLRPFNLKVRAVDEPPTYGRMGAPRRAATVREDHSFELEGLYGHQVLVVEGLPREWIVRSVRYRNEDVLGVPTEFKSSADPQDLQIVLTSRVASVVARVADEIGNPAKTGRVMMFSADLRHWANAPGMGNPFVHHGVQQKDGHISIGPVRSGEYFIVALAPEDYVYSPDRSRLEALAGSAERITLGDGEERQVELRIVRIP